jgi:hypothetical protein
MAGRPDADEEDSGQAERLQLFVDPQTITYLKAIAVTGTYGWRHTKVAKALIEEGIRRAIRDKLSRIFEMWRCEANFYDDPLLSEG